MSERKEQVSWTLDKTAVELVKQKAQQMSTETGAKISASEAANIIILEYGRVGIRVKGKTHGN